MAEGKTYKEIEREYAEIRRQGKEFEGLVPVKARVSKNLTFSFSVRYPPHELIAIEAAAKARGITISEFIRQAAAAAIAGDLSLDTGKKAQALSDVRERVLELSKAVQRLYQ